MKSVAGNVLPGDISPQEKWTAAELSERLCKVLDFAKLAVDCLAKEGYNIPGNTGQEEGVRPEKIVAETAFLLLVAHIYAQDNKEIISRINHTAEALMPYARSQKNFLSVCIHPSLALDYAQAHICLSKIGYPDQKFDDLLRQSMHATAKAGRERPPHRMLEQEWIKIMWNPDTYDPDIFHHAANYSLLGQPMDLLHGTRDDMYAFTHALMYVSGFGLFHALLPRGRAAILKEAEAMLARCLDEQDYDLAGELLLAWPLTGNTWSPFACFAFRTLMCVDEAAGFLPTPSTRLDILKKLDEDQRQKYFYATAYHTVYVLGLLCAAALQPGCAPVKNNFTAEPGKSGVKKLLPHLPLISPHWKGLFNELNDTEQESLTPMLLNIILYRKIQQRDYSRALDILRIADELGLAGLPFPQQTAELLDRLSLLA